MGIEMLVSTNAACALDNDGEVIGIFELGHVPPWALRQYDWAEYAGGESWPTREWWRDVPYSIQYPDDPPCDGGEESILFIPCKKTDAGAYPVTVIYFG